MYETEKTFDIIKKMQNTFNITDNFFSNQSPSVKDFNYLKTKRMSNEDLKTEVEKQNLHEYLSQSLIKKANLSDLANETLMNFDQNETTNLTSSGFSNN